jgi:hypothetical protein
VREAEYFIDVLSSKKLHLGALILNKTLPPYLLDEASGARARRLVGHADELGAQLAVSVEADAAQVGRVLREMGDNFQNFSVVAQREASQRNELARVPEVVSAVPEFDDDIHDLRGLLRLGEAMWS